jgi:polyisoprenoid-binding protein YceI
VNTTLDTHDPTSTTPETPKSPWRFAKWVAIGLVAAVALMYAGIFFYANVLNDAPDALDSNDLAESLAEPTDATPTDDAPADDVTEEAPADDAPEAEAPAEESPVEEAPASDEPAAESPASFDGVWVPTEASEFGYRVDEVLSGVNVTAVGRSNEIDGSLTIDGTAADIEVIVQVANIESDDGRRDGQFRGRIMSADEFPTASFVATQPIEFGEIPAEGEQVTAPVTGDLTLRGETRSVTFDVTAQVAGDRVGVLGNIPIVFADFGIPEPSIGTVSVEDNGLLEFVLVFEQG